MEYKIRQCFHCGNKGLMEVLYTNSYVNENPIFDELGEIESFGIEQRYAWTLLSCPVCKKLTLDQLYTDSVSNFNFDEYSILYPESSVSFEGVPQEIRTAFEAAFKVKNIDSEISLLALRRTLEAICKNKGAKGDSLNAMVQDLIGRNILPLQLNDACWIIRQLGNAAAHTGARLVEPYELEQTIRFLKTIINFLYTLPVQMERMKEHITESRAQQQYGHEHN